MIKESQGRDRLQDCCRGRDQIIDDDLEIRAYRSKLRNQEKEYRREGRQNTDLEGIRRLGTPSGSTLPGRAS
ncbi:MAG TPA: hypothetical protein VH593_16995 [Ktedonobacteraceae bacterium]